MNVRSQRGFSLVELMIVVAIIGILSAIAVPNFQRFQKKARQAEAKTHLTGVYTGQKAFFAEWNQYYGSLSEVGYIPDGTNRYNAGFDALGVGLPAGYTGPGNADEFNLIALCASAVNGANCQAAATLPGLGGVAAAPAGTGVGSTFTASAVGDIGGTVDDQWTLDQAKTMQNPQSGL